MVRHRHNFRPGGTFFFTLSLADHQSSALVDHMPALTKAMRDARTRAPFKIEAIVILPNHLHAILTMPEGDSDFPARWRHINSGFTIAVTTANPSAPRDARSEYALWQERYWEHMIRDEADFARHTEYIHGNPIMHNLVARASEWPHSSFHRYVRRGLLPADWAGTAKFAPEDFGEFEP
jgi:putative transposase